MTPVLRPRGRRGGFDDAALAKLALVVKTASLPPSRATAAVVQAALRCFKHLCETCHTLGLPHPANI